MKKSYVLNVLTNEFKKLSISGYIVISSNIEPATQLVYGCSIGVRSGLDSRHTGGLAFGMQFQQNRKCQRMITGNPAIAEPTAAMYEQYQLLRNSRAINRRSEDKP